jgi:hypothetical protein
MESWATLRDEPRRHAIMLAIEQHDNGWREPDAAPIVDESSGRILDFISAPEHVRQGIWPRGIARLAANSWAAALVAQHALTIYERFRIDPAWATFFQEIERLRDEHLGRSALDFDTLRHDYLYVQLGDLASLTFCNMWAEKQRLEGHTVHMDGTQLTIEPDPFDGRDVAIEIPARELTNRAYGTQSDALEAFAAARVVICSGTAIGR